MSPPQLSVLLPAFNEEANIGECLRRALAVYPRDAEFLVVDGGSDRTGEIVREIAREHPAVRYIRNEDDRGKGQCIRLGISHARAPVMAAIDTDLQYDPEDLPDLVEPILAGRADVTIGSRFMKESRRDEKASFWRTFGNHVLSWYATALVGHRMTDAISGMKAWTAEAAARIRIRSDNFSYELEIAITAVRLGLRVVDVPVATHERSAGASKVNFIADGLRFLGDATRFRLRRRPPAGPERPVGE